MKKLISILIILLMLPIAISQDETSLEETEDVSEENLGTLPDSPFYGLKLFKEKLFLALTFNQADKAEKRILHAQLRLKEMQIMLEKNKIKAAEKAQKQHEKLLEKLEKIEIKDPEKAAKIEEKLQQHERTLEKIREKAEKKLDLNEEQKERIGVMLDKIENGTKIAKQVAIIAITKNIEKLETANKSQQINAIQKLTKVREKLQKPISLKEKLQKRQVENDSFLNFEHIEIDEGLSE